MAGEIKRLLDKIVDERSKGNSAIMLTTKTKIILKGINFDSYTPASQDDQAVIAKVKQIAVELGVRI